VATPDDAATYLEKAPTGGSSSWTGAWTNPLTPGATINSVTVTTRCWLDGNNSVAAQGAIIYNGVTADQKLGGFTVDSWVTVAKTWATNPFTAGAWTFEDLATLSFGVKLTSVDEVGTPGALASKCTQTFMTLDYTAAVAAPTGGVIYVVED
jgi:hypothetical protein